MKRTSARQSTTDAPSPRIFGITARGIALSLAPSTAITLPVATATLKGHSVALAILAGLAPVLPLLLAAAVLVAIYAAATLLAITVTTVRLACRKADAANSLDSLFAWITNPLIALMTLTPLKVTKREAKGTGQVDAPTPLPAGAPGDARKQGTPFYWKLMHEMPLQNVEMQEGIMRDDLSGISVRGRHARPEDKVQPENRDRGTSKAA